MTSLNDEIIMALRTFFIIIKLNKKMSSQIKQICNSVYLEQVQSIRDLTSGHLNERHLYRPRQTINGIRKASWSSSQKPHPTLRPPHRLQTYATNVEQMKETLVDFTYLTLPEIPTKKSPKTPRVNFTFIFRYSNDYLIQLVRRTTITTIAKNNNNK